MLHRALLGSIERFFGVLIEHYAGAFPTWLAPTQVRVLPVAEAHEEYAAGVVDALRAAGARVDTSVADDGLGKRIRNAKLEKVPYVLVVGDDDVAAKTVGVNPRGGEVERGVAVDAFVQQFLREVHDAESDSARRLSGSDHVGANLVGMAFGLRRRRAGALRRRFGAGQRVHPAAAVRCPRRRDAHRPPGRDVLRDPEPVPVHVRACPGRFRTGRSRISTN